MKKTSVFIVLALVISACSPSLSPESIVKQIKAIHLVEAPIARNMRVMSYYDGGNKESLFENIALQAVPISRESSDIVITDTIGFKPGTDDNSVTPSAAGVNAIIDANIQPGDYYCQTYTNGKMTCERGQMGTHLNTNQLTTQHTYAASNHFASAAYQNSIIIFREEPSGAITTVRSYSTENQTVCVYNENGNLIVAIKN